MTTVPRADPIAYAVFVPIVAVDNVLPVHGHHGHQLRIETHIETAFKAALISLTRAVRLSLSLKIGITTDSKREVPICDALFSK